MNKICVYAIAKNEAQFVDRWYESMKEADCIAVLDTGSTDNTVEKLKAHDIIVDTKIIDPWRFDVARNKSLELVPDDCNILVCTDLDEVFEAGWAEALRNAWDDNIHERAEYTYIWQHNADGTPRVKYNYNKIHNRNWIWRTPVHEYLTRKDDDKNYYYKYENALRLHSSIILHHYPDEHKSRSSYLGLLKIRVEEYPDDRMSILYLAREYWFYKQYENAIDTLSLIVTDEPQSFRPIHTAFSYMIMGSCYAGLAFEQSDNDKKEYYLRLAETTFTTGITKFPTFMENYTYLGDLYASCEYYKEAAKTIELGFKRSIRLYDWVENGTNWFERPMTILGVCYFYMNDIGRSLACFNKVYMSNPDNKTYYNNLKMALDSISIADIINK